MNQTPTLNSRDANAALGLWEPKRALTLEAAHAHTQRIILLRRVLAWAAGLLICLFLAQFFIDRGGIDYIDNPDDAVKMVNPRYSGRTSDNLPFYLTADTATRAADDRDHLALTNPIMEFFREDGVPSSFVSAKTGVYDDVNKILDLYVDVHLITDNGYDCDSTYARVFARDKRITGDQPISCDGEFGHVTGKTYAIEDEYETFIFKKGMTALVENVEDVSDPEQASEFADMGFSGDAPILVTAVQGTYKGSRYNLVQDVRTVQLLTILTSDRMIIDREELDNGEEGGEDTTVGPRVLGPITKIDARGNFHYKTPENDIRGERGIYERTKRLMTVTGDVIAQQPNGNRVKSDKLFYRSETGEVRFASECKGQDCEDQPKSGRTRIIIPGTVEEPQGENGQEEGASGVDSTGDEQ